MKTSQRVMVVITFRSGNGPTACIDCSRIAASLDEDTAVHFAGLGVYEACLYE